RKKKPRARSGELPSLGSITRGVGRGTASAARTVGRAVKSTGQSVERRIVERVTGWGRFLRAQLTPFRLVLAGIMIMLTVTGVWAFHNRRLELAAETLRVEFEAGEAALRNDDLLAAVGHFEKAAAAADYL